MSNNTGILCTFRTSDPRRLNKGRGSMFCVDCRVRQTPEEGRWIYRPKRYEYNKEKNSTKTLNEKMKVTELPVVDRVLENTQMFGKTTE